MSGATGNLYFGLHEFADMAFMLHLLRPSDLMVDIGANVGTYTILAAKLSGAQVVSFEPDPGTADRLDRNIAANHISDLVDVRRHALGAAEGVIGFTAGLDAMNRVTEVAEEIGQRVPVHRLDSVMATHEPTMIKIDVEGHEDAVFAAAEATLAKPSLLAIEAETVSENTHALLLGLGFERFWYAPQRRLLSPEPMDNQANNSLYVRNREHVDRRLTSAASVDIFGWHV